jgi:2-polyprenyl-3-methyl-5-hydroxy-6-metoxy-1,4-benzoquinol methylase
MRFAMTEDASGDWEAVAMDFAAARSDIGSDVVRRWATSLRPGGDVVDIGCGSGEPVSLVLASEGLSVFGIDASPTLLSMFKRRLPHAYAACEAAQHSAFFGRKFDGAIAVGLIFLLPEDDQGKLIARVGQALSPGAHFLFSVPSIRCEWKDFQTGNISRSLGDARYLELLAEAGLHLVNRYIDDGGNEYLDAMAK